MAESILTKQAISHSLKELSQDKAFDKISVGEISEAAKLKIHFLGHVKTKVFAGFRPAYAVVFFGIEYCTVEIENNCFNHCI